MNNRHYFSTSSGRIELDLSGEDARRGYHPGQCIDDVRDLAREPYIAEQLARIDPALLRAELAEYGAWDEADLASHADNLERILWLACGDIADQLDAEDV